MSRNSGAHNRSPDQRRNSACKWSAGVKKLPQRRTDLPGVWRSSRGRLRPNSRRFRVAAGASGWRLLPVGAP
jgi:hypothetical protein